MLTRWCSVAIVAAAATPDWVGRLPARWRAFLDLIRHDHQGVTESPELRLPLLLTWLAANLLAFPVALLVVRVLGMRREARKVLFVNAWLSVIQVAFFTMHWYLIAWGQRSLDWAVFFVSLMPSALVVTTLVESRLKEADRTTFVCPMSALSVVPVMAFQRRAVPSSLAVTMSAPSRLNAADVRAVPWPSRTA